MSSRRIALALLSLFVPFIIDGCTNDPVSPERPFSVTVTDLPPLGAGAHYELWFSYPSGASQQKGPRPDHEDANYFSVGRFNIDASGNLTGATGGAAHFAIPSGYNAQLIGDAVVTVEKANDNHTKPGPRVLGGLISGTESKASSVLSPEDGDALGGRILVDSIGYASLVAPTSDVPADSVSGVWFVRFITDLSGLPTDTVAGLALPPQPLNPDNPDWTYTAWLVRNEGTAGAEYVNIGHFNMPDGPDDDLAGPGAGSAGSHYFRTPGSDFVSGTRRTLNDGTYDVVISVDPTAIALPRPLVTVLKSEKIAAGYPSRSKIALFRPLVTPVLQFDLDR